VPLWADPGPVLRSYTRRVCAQGLKSPPPAKKTMASNKRGTTTTAAAASKPMAVVDKQKVGERCQRAHPEHINFIFFYFLFIYF
jgi:hypothetical protein